MRVSAWTSGSCYATLRGSVCTNVGTIPLNDTQLRATPVPISGVVTGPVTDAELRAAAVPVLGPVTDLELGVQLQTSKFGQTLLEILHELKKMNTHFSLITDEEV